MATGSVDEYLAGVPEKYRALLEKLRRQIRTAAPEAIETISYKIPTFKYRGRALLYFAAHKDHCSLYPYTDAMMEKCGDELAGRATGKGTIRFTPADPLPAALVTKLVKIRMAEIDAGDG
jgi:uncharacterized protein YdhG (YjbR/CyaY superfamily)